MEYYELLDIYNSGDIVKTDHAKEYIYRFGEDKWTETDVMSRYLSPEGEHYGQYRIIPETDIDETLRNKKAFLLGLLELAEKTAAEAHSGQYDKGGQPYILHPQTVASYLLDTEEKIIALLHDTIEDTFVTKEYLLSIGFTPRIADTVALLSKPEDMDYFEYLAKIKENPLAKAVKLADLKHNSDIGRIPCPTEYDLLRRQKYLSAIEFLNS